MKTPKKQTPRERLFLLDGMALAYRAYFSFITRPLINSKGENTSAIYGFTTTLMKILNDEKPDHIAVVFDTKEPTFRHIMYQPYKATRQKMPEDMASQLDRLKDVVRAFNVPCIEAPGYEADDIIGTLARKAEREGIAAFLVTPDKDFMQLISPLIRMYRPGKRSDEWEIVDEEGVRERFGVKPGQVTDVLGLTGDKSDNVPGIRGIGDKTAIPLINEFGSLENLIGNVESIPQKGLREKLEQEKDNALLSKKLVTIDVNVPLSIDLHHLTAKPKDDEKLVHLFSELEFRSLLKKIQTQASVPDRITAPPAEQPAGPQTDITSDPHTYHLVRNKKELIGLASKLRKAGIMAFDTETTSLDPYQARLVGISLATKAGEAWYVPVHPTSDGTRSASHKISGETSKPSSDNELFSSAEVQKTQVTDSSAAFHPSHTASFPTDVIVRHLGPVFSDPSVRKIGQNAKFDVMILDAAGLHTEGVIFDTMVASYLLRPDASHNLDSLASEYLSYTMISYDDLTGTGKEKKELPEIPVEAIAEYSAQDADITFRLYECLSPRLDETGLSDLGKRIEFPLIEVLADMEMTGIALDIAYLSELSAEMEKTLQDLTRDICGIAGETFNLNSTQQLGKILFEKLKLPAVRKTKTGFSTDAGVLDELRKQHPIIEKLLEYRQIQKLKSTYVDALPSLLNPVTGRVHTSFNQTVVATGRLSSSNPNLQNIPIRTDLGRNIRKAFVAGSPDMRILSADYSQIELRIMAHMSGDESLSEAFRNGEDIHTTTAARVFGTGSADVTREMRRRAKEINYGIMYGIGPFGLASRLDIAQSEAKAIIDTYFARFPKVRQYINDILATARRTGYAATLLGRRRYFTDINSRNQTMRSNAERQAINMPIQGTAADMIKLAMVAIHRLLKDDSLGARMLLQVHDELVFEVKDKTSSKVKELIIREMVNALPLTVPVEVEAGVGMNWLEAH